MPVQEQLRIRALAQWREEQAQDHNLPRSWVLADDALRELAHKPPATVALLKSRRVFRDETVDRVGEKLMLALAGAQHASMEGLSQKAPGKPSAEELAQLKRLTDCVALIAAELKIPAETLATQRDLKRLARGDRDESSLLRGWRGTVVGPALLNAL